MGVPGFADTAPDCGGAVPGFLQELACPHECDHECRQDCTHRASVRCKRCQKNCLDRCYFVPCCNRIQQCNENVLEIRAECYQDWESSRDNTPEVTGWASTGEFCGQ